MSERPRFISTQLLWTAHLRDPQRHPAPPGVDPRRMRVYSELLYNNVEGLLANSFPVLHEVLGERRWHALVRDYFARHVARTPLFTEMPHEFVRYLQAVRRPGADDPPFLAELAHYEWVEIGLGLAAEEVDAPGVDPAGDPLDNVPVLSALAWPLVYRFPVHRIAADFRPQQPGEARTHLVVYRDRADRVGFMELNAVTALLLEAIAGNAQGLTGRALLEGMAQALGHSRPDAVLRGGADILRDMLSRDILAGTRPPGAAGGE